MTAHHPEHAHATDRPATSTFTTRPAHMTIGWCQDRRPVVSKLPLHSHAAAKTSPHICIGPEPVLAVYARSPPAAGSHHLAGADIAPHSEQNFFKICTVVQIISSMVLIFGTKVVPVTAFTITLSFFRQCLYVEITSNTQLWYSCLSSVFPPMCIHTNVCVFLPMS